jgi:hypothetical protein
MDKLSKKIEDFTSDLTDAETVIAIMALAKNLGAGAQERSEIRSIIRTAGETETDPDERIRW